MYIVQCDYGALQLSTSGKAPREGILRDSNKVTVFESFEAAKAAVNRTLSFDQQTNNSYSARWGRVRYLQIERSIAVEVIRMNEVQRPQVERAE
ncbi:MAG: hypothetical protein WBV94_07380 [Blastocatellia bacterium]